MTAVHVADRGAAMLETVRSAFILEDLPESQDWLARALAADLEADIALVDLGLPDGTGADSST